MTDKINEAVQIVKDFLNEHEDKRVKSGREVDDGDMQVAFTCASIAQRISRLKEVSNEN